MSCNSITGHQQSALSEGTVSSAFNLSTAKPGTFQVHLGLQWLESTGDTEADESSARIIALPFLLISQNPDRSLVMLKVKKKKKKNYLIIISVPNKLLSIQ
jgi:hypothetical protein